MDNGHHLARTNGLSGFLNKTRVTYNGKYYNNNTKQGFYKR